MHASGNLVEVDILELSRFLCRGFGNVSLQHVTGSDDGEGIRPETDTGHC